MSAHPIVSDNCCVHCMGKAMLFWLSCLPTLVSFLALVLQYKINVSYVMHEYNIYRSLYTLSNGGTSLLAPRWHKVPSKIWYRVAVTFSNISCSTSFLSPEVVQLTSLNEHNLAKWTCAAFCTYLCVCLEVRCSIGWFQSLCIHHGIR